MLESYIEKNDILLCPSGVPFIEMLEFKTKTGIEHDGPSGVPFIEMLESDYPSWEWVSRPSGVPFIEMLEYGIV